LEWLDDHNHGDAGIICSNKEKRRTQTNNNVEHHSTRRKAGGLLRHSLHNLKRVARLLCKDRKEVLHVLKKNVRKRRRAIGNKYLQEKSFAMSKSSNS